MPLYEYKCDRCGDLFEVIEKFSASPLQEHAGCGGHVERQLSAPALQFKGTGWYVTDYAKNSSNGKSSKGENKSEGKSEAKSEGKSETKSESKSETKSDSSKSSTSSTSTDKK